MCVKHVGCCQTSFRLADPTQLWLCFPPCHKKKNKNRNPHQSSTKRKGPTCLKFGEYLTGIRIVPKRCLEGAKKACGVEEGIWRVSRGRLKGALVVWKVFERCFEQVKSGQVKSLFYKDSFIHCQDTGTLGKKFKHWKQTRHLSERSIFKYANWPRLQI